MNPYDGSRPLTTSADEAFAQAVARCNNLSRAYRETHPIAPDMKPRTVWEMASRLANSLAVSVRVDWLRAQALERSQISVAALMRDLYDIATADPSELTQMRVTCCRHCHGPGFKYQWLNADEYATACDVAAKAKQDPPSCDGGFEFDPLAEPHGACPHCYGMGIRQVWVADTSSLSDKARKLYKGVKQKADGSIEILMHDQLVARDQLHKLAGAYKETLRVPERPAEDTGPMTPERAEQAYLRLVQGGKAG